MANFRANCDISRRLRTLMRILTRRTKLLSRQSQRSLTWLSQEQKLRFIKVRMRRKSPKIKALETILLTFWMAKKILMLMIKPTDTVCKTVMI